MRRSGVRIPLAPPQTDIRSGCRFFVCPGVSSRCCAAPRVFRALRCAALWGRAAQCARGQRPAREPSAPRAFGSARRLEARPGPATAHRHRILARVSKPALAPHHPPAPRPGYPDPPHRRHLRCCGARTGPVGTHRDRGQAQLPPTGVAGDSGETVIACAGVCSVFGETDGTIARHMPLFSALFWCAKASWVSWRCPEVPALVLTVSSRGAVSSMGVTKFAQRRLSMTIARKHSPSAGKMAQNECFIVCWASFFAAVGR